MSDDVPVPEDEAGSCVRVRAFLFDLVLVLTDAYVCMLCVKIMCVLLCFSSPNSSLPLPPTHVLLSRGDNFWSILLKYVLGQENI
jgi:hypothetical protein